MKSTLMFVMLAVASFQTSQSQAGSYTVEGTVVRSDNAGPVNGAAVELHGGNAAKAPVVQTDSTGHFRFSNLTAGRYFVYVTRDGFFGNCLETCQKAVEIQFELGSADPPKPVTLTLIPAATIAGEVFDANGHPLALSTVSAWRTDTGEQAIGSGSRATDTSGQYRMFGLPPGSYYVGVGLAGAAQTEVYSPSEISFTTADKVTVAGGDEKIANIRIPQLPGASIRGSIVNATTGAAIPIKSVALSVVRRDTPTPRRMVAMMANAIRAASLNTAPDRAGNAFELHDLQPGVYDLFAVNRSGNGGFMDRSGDGSFMSGHMEFELNGRDLNGMTITLEPSVEVRGRLIVDGGMPAAGGPRPRLEASDPYVEAGLDNASATVNRDEQTFVIPFVAPGKYKMYLAPAALVGLGQFDFEIRQNGVTLPGKTEINVGASSPAIVDIIVHPKTPARTGAR